MHRRKHKPYVFIVIALMAAVGFMTWQDMQKVADKNIARLKMAQYVRADEDPQTIPANHLPLYIEAGAITTNAENGAADFTPSALAPQTVAQREINLIVQIDHVPNTLTGAAEHISKLAADWKGHNNILNELVMDWQIENPPLDKMALFATMATESMSRSYWMAMILKRSWFDADPQIVMALGRTRAVNSYIFDIQEAARDGETLAETIAALNALQINFVMIADTLPPRDVLADLSAANDFFHGFILHERLPVR